MVLGRDTLEEYLNNKGYFGALIGRNSNRIENAEFELNGEKYTLCKNNKENNIHGGKIGFDKKIWNAQMFDEEEPRLVLTLVSPDGEEGFPGTVKVKVEYSLTKDNGIKIHYTGECDKDTVLNMTNHTYFNLNGHDSGTINGHIMKINSEFFLPNNEKGLPTGEVLRVENTPMDFINETELGKMLTSEHEQILKAKGLDHNFAICGRGFRCAAKISGEKTGITMKVYTDRAGMHVYTGNSFERDRMCKDRVIYGLHNGICFETQAFPNSLKFSHFPGAILKKGEKYDTVTIYKFM